MSKHDEPRCDHGRSEVIVTNQPGGYDKTRAHASTWVCAEPGCVLDAMRYVQRFTKEKPWWRIGVDGVWRDEPYPTDAEIEGRDEPEPWEGHPDVPVSEDELARLIAQDWERVAGR